MDRMPSLTISSTLVALAPVTLLVLAQEVKQRF